MTDESGTAVDHPLLVQLAATFAQEFYLTLHESLVSEVAHCVKDRSVALDAAGESSLVRAIMQALYGPGHDGVGHLEDLLTHFAEMHRRLAEFVRRKFIYQETVTVPFACFDLDLFKRVVALIKKHIPVLARSQFTVLLDEYENLLPFQKLVVNSLIKLGPPSLSVKVARKVGTEETSSTTVGQELQETHDYNRISLIYSVEDAADFARYLGLLESMVAKLLASHSLPATPLSTLLPADESDEVTPSALQQEILALLKMSAEEFDCLDEPTKAAKVTYYKHAAVYRQLGRRTAKRFSGHKDLAFISSGVIRFFQEILGMAYHLQVTSGACTTLAIDPRFQSQAVHTVSGHNLATLSRNVETYGEQLKYFLLDLGDCLRQKLLRHTSEPEAARIAIKDPQLLKTEKFRLLNTFLNLGVKEGVFQTVSGRPGIRPKHVDDPQPVEINITRIFAPALQISPRLRWTSQVNCSDLLGLLDGDQRRKTKSKLLRHWAKVGDESHARAASLFAEDEHEDTV